MVLGGDGGKILGITQLHELLESLSERNRNISSYLRKESLVLCRDLGRQKSFNLQPHSVGNSRCTGIISR